MVVSIMIPNVISIPFLIHVRKLFLRIRLELLLLLAVRWTFRYYFRYHFRYHDRSGLGGFGGGSNALFDYSLEDQFLVVRVARAAGRAGVRAWSKNDFGWSTFPLLTLM